MRKINRRKRKEKSKVDGWSTLPVGPGGINCNCCFPAPGSRARKMRFRLARRRAKRLHMKEQLEE